MEQKRRWVDPNRPLDLHTNYITLVSNPAKFLIDTENRKTLQNIEYNMNMTKIWTYLNDF